MPASAIRALASLGQRDFGENYVQEAMAKQEDLNDLNLCWHFIGHVQSNKTAQIAAHFDWVHSVDRLKIARRLSDQRPAGCAPINICLQVNLQDEAGKGGLSPQDVADVAHGAAQLPRVALRGLMLIPRPEHDPARQRQVYEQLRELQESLNAGGLALDTLSMGMSGDWDAAVAAGATWIRIGTALFGER